MPTPDRPAGPPGLSPWHLPRTVATLLRMARDPYAFVGSRFAAHGDLYHVDEGRGRHLYVTRHPDHIREVLVTRATSFRKRGGANDRLVPVLGDGLLTSDGEVWRRQRRKVQPAFRRAVLDSYADTMVTYARRLDWADGATFDLSDEMMRLTLGIVCKALFDHDITGDTDTVGRAMAALLQGSQPTLTPSWVPTPQRRRMARAMAAIDQLIVDLVAQRQAEGLRSDLLSLLLAADMPPRALRDELVTLFLAGHETTSHALTWTFVLLATHPEIEARLVTELQTVLGGREAVLGDLDALSFTAQIVDEAMRLYPPAFAVARVAAEDTTVGGFPLAEGSQIVSWIWHCHRDPRWFEDPDAFRPDRFAAPAFPEHAYLPFGAGARKCIGAGFARMELRLLLANLMQRYRLSLVDDGVPTPHPRVTLSPKGAVRVRVTHREGRTGHT